MSKLWSKIILGLVTAFVIGISNANAELTCVAQPSCAMLGYSKTNVPNCTSYIHCPFDTSYKKCVTLDHTEGKCTGYSLADCPPHAKCEPCGSYKISSCADGYKVDGDTCICATVCADRLTQKDIPLNAGPIKQSCNACGAVSDIITGWECNSGYVNISGECKQAYSGCEAAGYLSSPKSNATCSTVSVYTSSGSTMTCYSGCTCKSGYTGDPCVCATTCTDKVTSKPDNASYTYESCTACGSSYSIKSGWTCDSGYVKSGNSCVCPSGTYDSKALCESNNPYSNCTIDVKCYKPTSCKSGYAKSASACGSKSGWALGDADYYGCRRCNKKECPDVMMKVPYYGNSSGSASGSAGYGYTYRLLSSSITNNAYACGTQGSKGWTTVLTSNYSGDNACYACKPNACPTGYSAGRTSVADCGTGGAANWEFYIANNATYGEEICSKCVRKTTTCPSGYTAGLTNASKCGSKGAKGWTVKTQGVCGKCVAKECVAGMSENTTGEKVSGVPLGSYEKSYYFDFSPNAYYTGDARCGTFTLKPEEVCADYIRNKKSCGNGIDYDDSTYNNIFEACEAGGYADCTSLYDCIKEINANWKVYDLNYCSLCGGASDDGIACM